MTINACLELINKKIIIHKLIKNKYVFDYIVSLEYLVDKV